MGNSSSNVRISRLIHAAVRNRSGALLGHVDELLVDANDGRIEYALLALVDAAGRPGRVVAVPWSALDAPGGGLSGGEYFVLDASPATLRAIGSYS